MIKDSKCIYLTKGKMKGFQGVHLNIALSLIMTVMSPKRWRVYALCFCSLWGFCSVAAIFGPFSKLSALALLTTTGRWVSQQPADPSP